MVKAILRFIHQDGRSKTLKIIATIRTSLSLVLCYWCLSGVAIGGTGKDSNNNQTRLGSAEELPLYVELVQLSDKILTLAQLKQPGKSANKLPPGVRLQNTSNLGYLTVSALLFNSQIQDSGRPENSEKLTTSKDRYVETLKHLLNSSIQQLRNGLPDTLEIRSSTPPSTDKGVLLHSALNNLQIATGLLNTAGRNQQLELIGHCINLAVSTLDDISAILQAEFPREGYPNSTNKTVSNRLVNLDAHKSLQKIYRLQRSLNLPAELPSTFPPGKITHSDILESSTAILAELIAIRLDMAPEQDFELPVALEAKASEIRMQGKIFNLGKQLEHLVAANFAH